MTPEQFKRVEELFDEARRLPPDQHQPFLAKHCPDDQLVRARVEQMLDRHDDATRTEGDRRTPPRSTGDRIDAHGLIGQSIGPYKLLERLGEGGFGVVYLAEQTEPVRRRVALKVIKPGMDTAAVIARFEAERQALALMNHPNVARVFDAGATGQGRPFFVMEHVPGVPITEHCDRHRLSLDERLDLFMQACEAVQHAHQKGIIHRDLKPSNILVSVKEGKPQLKVIDFGVAKAIAQRLTERTIFTEQGQMIGTPEYMSPEQAEMTAQDIDTRSDIYSLGVLLYELLTGSVPFDKKSLRLAAFDEIRRIIREVDPPKPSTRLGALSSKPQAPVISEPRPSGSGPAPTTLTSVLAVDEFLDAATDSPPARERRGERVPIAGPEPARDGGQSALEDIASKRGSDARSLTRRLRGDLDCITMKALEKDRNRRYATATEFAADLARHLNHEPVIARPPSAGYKLHKFVRRNRGGVIAGSLVLSALILGVIGTSIMYFRAVDERERAVLAEREQSRARREAEGQRNLAEQREKEIEQVAEFQVTQFSDIDTALMGVRLRGGVIAKRRTALEERGSDQAAVEAGLGELEASLVGVNFTNVALETLDENIFKRALAAIEKQFADQPQVKARLLQTVADTLRDIGLLHRATRPQEEALRIRREALGDDHPDTLTSISNMGTLLQTQGKPAEAEPYCREALESRRRVLGDDHPETLMSINAMGALLHTQGKRAEAEPHYREALERSRRVLGDDHPETLGLINNMGIVLNSQGKPAEAEPYFREALETRRRALGDDHANTLNSICNMGSVLDSQGKLSEAEPYYRQAVEGYRRVLGDDHPSTLVSINNMGYLLNAQGKLAEAEPYFREALKGYRRVLGDDHPNTITLINNMGALLLAQSKLAEAEPYYREALERSRRVSGDDHPDTLGSINNMGYLLQAQGKLAEAEPYFREALDGRRRVLGDDHPLTLSSINNIGTLLKAQGKLAEAIALLEPAEPAARRAFTGGNAFRLGRFLTALGRSRSATGAFDVAEIILTEAHAILSEAKGPMPKDREDVLTGLVELYDSWHAAEPDKGYDAKAAEWRTKLPIQTDGGVRP